MAPLVPGSAGPTAAVLAALAVGTALLAFRARSALRAGATAEEPQVEPRPGWSEDGDDALGREPGTERIREITDRIERRAAERGVDGGREERDAEADREAERGAHER